MEIVKVIDWQAVLFESAAVCEKKFGIILELDRDVLGEVAIQVNASLQALNMNTLPNVAKVAGHVAFWIRKLKPVSHAKDSTNKLLTINEVIAILVGVGICRMYFDDNSKAGFKAPNRLMKDWAMSLRTHSHSPHSCAITFEFLASAQ